MTPGTRTWTGCCSTTAPTRGPGLVGFDGGHHPRRQSELLAHDVGVDGGAASAEEAAVHVVEDDDNDVRSDG